MHLNSNIIKGGDLASRMLFMSSSAAAIVRLKFLISVACVRLCHHIETQYNRVLTGHTFSNQSTNNGVRQQWFHC